jgi:hypothetical protein
VEDQKAAIGRYLERLLIARRTSELFIHGWIIVSSNLCLTAINEKLDSREKTGFIHGQEQCRPGDFVSFAHASIGIMDTILARTSSGC